MDLFISSFDDARQFRGRVTHIISMIDPEDQEFLPAMNVPMGRHLVLYCHDVDSFAEAKENCCSTCARLAWCSKTSGATTTRIGPTASSAT